MQEQACLALGNIASAHSNIATQQRALELGALDLLLRLRGSSSAKVRVRVRVRVRDRVRVSS